MAQSKKRGEILEQTAIRIPFEHVNPRLQFIIGSKNRIPWGEVNFPPSNFLNLKEVRMGRGISEFFLTLGILDITKVINKSPSLPMNALGMSAFALIRTGFVRLIQKKHAQLINLMNKHGILNTQSEGHYPFQWMNPTQVAKTHPIFYVTGRGDIVFKKPTRLEYMRYLDQQRWYGKIGLTPWRWRAYLEPPKVPEKIKGWALAKLKEVWAKRPKLAPAPVRVPVRGYRKQIRRRLRPEQRTINRRK